MNATHWFNTATHAFCLFQRKAGTSAWTCTAMKLNGKRKLRFSSGGISCDGTQDNSALGALVRLCDHLSIDQGGAVSAALADGNLVLA